MKVWRIFKDEITRNLLACLAVKKNFLNRSALAKLGQDYSDTF